MSTSFTQVFGGTTIYPSDVSYLALPLTADISLEWPLEATTGNNVVARIIDVTPTGPYTITMPDAMSVGVGQTVLFNNLGPDTITVDNAAGNAILSIGAGEQWQCYLINNTSAGGVWRTFRYGAAVAQAQAAALAGAGLIADGSELAQNYDVTEFSITPYNLTAPDRAKVFVWAGGLGTLNLPTAVAAGDGWFVQVRNGGQGDLTVDPSGSELINAGSTLTLQPGDSAVVVSDGIQWYTIGLGQQAVFAFDYTVIDVAPGGTYTLAGSELNRIAYRFNNTTPLTSNVVVVVPATVQQYWVNNTTTGSFTLGLQASGGSTTTLVPQGETAILYCDGTDIIAATTSSPFAGILPVLQGGTGANNAPSALANLGGTGIGTAVFTANTTAAARTAIAAAASGANSDITSLTGLTTPITVAQGGTGGTTQATARAGIAAAASGSNADITALTNAAGIQVGAPTGGAQGVGTVNATGLFINGVGVGTGSGSVTSVAVSGGTTGLTTSGGPITTSGTITFAGTLNVANGGTGQTSYTDGQLLIGNSTGNTLTKATLTAGSGISVTNSAGGITIAATGGGGTVSSVAASGGTTGLSFTGSPITTSGTLTLGGTLAITSGGTGATSASGARLNLSAAGSGANSDITSLSGLTTALSVGQGGTGVATAPTNGQLLIGNGTGYSVATLTAGSGITVTNSAGGVTIAASAFSGVLGVANGGTGASTLTSGYLLKGNGASAVSASVLYETGTFVGFNTATPQATIDFGGTANQSIFLYNSGTDRYGAAVQGADGGATGLSIFSGYEGPIRLRTSGLTTTPVTRVTISTLGDVGIGVTSPVYRLDVAGPSRFVNGSTSFPAYASASVTRTVMVGGYGTTNQVAAQIYGAQIGQLWLGGNYTSGTNFPVGSTGYLYAPRSTTDEYVARIGAIECLNSTTTSSSGGKLSFKTRNSADNSFNETVRFDENGDVYMYYVYNSIVGGTNRDLFIDSSFKLGYVSSTRASKMDIEGLSDVSWLSALDPVQFKYRKQEDGTYTNEPDGELQYGLIAEEVEAVNPNLVFYDETENGSELRGISYSKLVVPMLKALQEATTKIEELTARVVELEGK